MKEGGNQVRGEAQGRARGDKAGRVPSVWRKRFLVCTSETLRHKRPGVCM